MNLLLSLKDHLNDGASINDVKVEKLICEIAICISQNVINPSDFHEVLNGYNNEEVRNDCLKFYDAVLFYITNYTD